MWRLTWRILEALVAACVFGSPSSAQAQDSPGTVPPAQGDVEVHGAPLTPAGGERDESVAGSTIRRVDLGRPGLDAGEALRTEVGTSVTETGGLGAAATASIRGATAAETPVYLGGVRINDDVAGAADLSTLPLWLIERVEIYRGNAPFEADRFGIGGAIFFEPLRPHDTRLALGAGAGSYGSSSAWTYATAGDDEHALLVGLSLAGARNDYRYSPTEGPAGASAGPERRLTNADASLLDLWLIGRSNVGAGSVEVTANHFVREQGVQRLAVTPTYDARLELERSLGSIVGRAPLGKHALLELRTSAVVADSALEDPRTPSVLSDVGAPGHRLEQRGERVEQELNLRFELGKSTRVRVALDGSSERLRRYEENAAQNLVAVLDARRRTGRIAGMAERDFASWLSVRALLALECHATSAGVASGGCDTLEPTGRLSALAQQGELSGFMAVGRYTRPPTLGELYGTSLAVHGTPALVPETGGTVDVGARYAHALPGEARPLYGAASGYFRRSSELIQWVRTSQNYLVSENVGRTDVTGLELEGGSGFARYFAANVAVTLADFRDHTPGQPLKNNLLPHHSRLIVAPALEAMTPDLGHTLSRATLGARLLYQSNRYADNAGQEIIPEQASLDLDASVSCLRGVLILRGRVADALDANRYDIVGFPLPRRSVFVSAEVRLAPL